MSVARRIGAAVVTAALAVGAVGKTDAAPEVAPAAPNTLWSFLGIPQGINKIRDATKNKKGNHPDKERKPPLKRIADPQNLESQNPAIKAAAKVKSEEDLAPQKIKAIKYLASVGCGCYPDVRDALMAALDDCTEEVRYEAAIALCQAAGSPCKNCERSGCCNAAVMTKLEEMAHEQDEKGCFKESSPRVRAAAENALNACRRKVPRGVQAAPEAAPKKELPIQAAPEMPMPPSSPMPAPKPSLNNGAAWWPERGTPRGNSQSAPARKIAANANPVGAAGYMEVEDEGSSTATDNTVALAPCPVRTRSRPCPRGYEPTICPQEQPAPSGEGKAAPGEAVAGDTGGQSALPSNALAGNFGAASGPSSASPNMIGDFFGGSARFFGAGVLGGVQNASAGIAGGDRRFKIVEAESPILADRVFFNYNHFQNPLQDINGESRNLDRYTFGIEKTFRDQRWSVELRGPLSSNYDSTQSLVAGASQADTEFGDLAMAVKRLLYKRDGFMVSTGLGIVFPTGQNWVITDGTETLVEMKNESVHLQPFFGAMWEPNDRLFCIAFTQIDFDTHGNTVLMRDPSGFGDLDSVGVFQEQNLCFLDLSVGYWLFKNRCTGWISGIAPVMEIHYATTMQDEDLVTGPLGSFGASNPQEGPVGPGRRDILNLTGGLHFQLGACSTLTVAAVAPLRTGENREYDAEIAVQFNRRF